MFRQFAYRIEIRIIVKKRWYSNFVVVQCASIVWWRKRKKIFYNQLSISCSALVGNKDITVRWLITIFDLCKWNVVLQVRTPIIFIALTVLYARESELTQHHFHPMTSSTPMFTHFNYVYDFINYANQHSQHAANNFGTFRTCCSWHSLCMTQSS